MHHFLFFFSFPTRFFTTLPASCYSQYPELNLKHRNFADIVLLHSPLSLKYRNKNVTCELTGKHIGKHALSRSHNGVKIIRCCSQHTLTYVCSLLLESLEAWAAAFLLSNSSLFQTSPVPLRPSSTTWRANFSSWKSNNQIWWALHRPGGVL